MYFEPKTFGKRLQELRKEKGFTQEKMAEELNVSVPHLKKLESGERSCSIELVLIVSEYFGVTTDYLLKGNVRDKADEKEKLMAVIEELTAIAHGM